MQKMQFCQRKVLVLNKLMVAIGVTSLKRAITMLTSGDAQGTVKAEVVDNYHVPRTWEEWSKLRPKDGDDKIVTVGRDFCMPQIIRLNDYDKLPSQKIKFSRRTIFKRDNNKCQYCKKKFPLSELSMDHIYPKSAGGKTIWENVCLACVACNTYKANIIPKKSIVMENGKAVTYFTVEFRNDKKVWYVRIKEPAKPNYNLSIGPIHYESWKQWLDSMYWSVELENDNLS
jgi:5-methylcytosine-specific restriction endonuclease McrA